MAGINAELKAPPGTSGPSHGPPCSAVTHRPLHGLRSAWLLWVGSRNLPSSWPAASWPAHIHSLGSSCHVKFQPFWERAKAAETATEEENPQLSMSLAHTWWSPPWKTPSSPCLPGNLLPTFSDSLHVTTCPLPARLLTPPSVHPQPWHPKDAAYYPHGSMSNEVTGPEKVLGEGVFSEGGMMGEPSHEQMKGSI